MDGMDVQTPPAEPAAPAAAGSVGSVPGETPEQRDIRENKDIAAFSYLWIMSVIVYVLRRDSPFVRYHSKQAMILFLVSILVWLIPYAGRLLALVLFGGMVMGFMAAAQGERRDIPIVGRLSRGEITLRQAWKEIVSFVASAVRAVQEVVRKAPKEPKPAAAPTAPVVPAAIALPHDASTVSPQTTASAESLAHAAAPVPPTAETPLPVSPAPPAL